MRPIPFAGTRSFPLLAVMTALSFSLSGCATTLRSDAQTQLVENSMRPRPQISVENLSTQSHPTSDLPDQISHDEINAAPDELVEPLEIDPQTAADPALTSDAAKQVSKDVLEAEKGLEHADRSQIQVPSEINARIQTWIKYFTGRGRDRFQRYLDRGERYRPMIEATLSEVGVPKELYYIALIESGFSTSALSHAGAQGIWQFIRGTGRNYGLKVEAAVDERRDPIRSTRSAAHYLRDLHNIFNSWHLAMAAYNAGEFRIIGAVKRSGSRDFWDLAARRKLPKETMNYVPKFLAALTLGTYPERYGFVINRVEHYPEVRALNVRGGVTLGQIASVTNLSLAELRELNPHLRTGTTPRGGNYAVWVRRSISSQADSQVATLYPLRSAPKTSKTVAKHRSSKPATRSPATVHRVNRGDTLQSIARRHRMTVGELKRMNSLRSSKIQPGQRLKVLTREGDRSQS